MLVMDEKKFEDIVTDYESFKIFLDDYTEHIYQRIALKIPEIIFHFLRERKELTKAIGDFFKKNPDYSKHKDLLGKVANAVAMENPDYTVKEIFDAATERFEAMDIKALN